MGQAERDRRRVERLEIERQHMEQQALKDAELLNPPDPAEALNHLKPDVTWGENDVSIICVCTRSIKHCLLLIQRSCADSFHTSIPKRNPRLETSTYQFSEGIWVVSRV